MKVNNKYLPSTTITTDDGRQDLKDPEPQLRCSPRARKPTRSAKFTKNKKERK